VLGPRGRAGDKDVEDVLSGLVLLDEGVVLFLDPVNARAFLPLGRYSEALEHLLEVAHLLARLLEVVLERFAQLVVADLLGERGKHLRQRLLGVVDVLQFVDEEVLG